VEVNPYRLPIFFSITNEPGYRLRRVVARPCSEEPLHSSPTLLCSAGPTRSVVASTSTLGGIPSLLLGAHRGDVLRRRRPRDHGVYEQLQRDAVRLGYRSPILPRARYAYRSGRVYPGVREAVTQLRLAGEESDGLFVWRAP
jgi:hypothetical protein